MKSPTTNNERVRTPRKNKKQKGSVYQRTSKKERSSRKRKNSRKERRKQKRTKRKNKNRIYIKRRIEGGAEEPSPQDEQEQEASSPASTPQEEEKAGYLVVDIINAPQKYNIKEDLRKGMPDMLAKIDNKDYNLDNFTPLWRDLEVHIDENQKYYYKIRSCNSSKGLKNDYLGNCLKKDIPPLKKGNTTDWGDEKIKLFNGDLKKIQEGDTKNILGQIPEEFIIQLFKHIVCDSKHPVHEPEEGSEGDAVISVSGSEKDSSGAFEMVSIDTNDLESLSNFQAEEEDTEGHEPGPYIALQKRVLDAQTRLTLLGYIPTLGCLPKKDAYMLEYTVKQKVSTIQELLAPFKIVQRPPDVAHVAKDIESKLEKFITEGEITKKEDRVKKVNEIKVLVQQLKDGENKKNIGIIIDKLDGLGDDGTCRWQNKNGINDFITFLLSRKPKSPGSPWSIPGEPDEEKALNEIKGIIHASREKYKEAVLDWGAARARRDKDFDGKEEVMATIYKRGYIEEHLLALMKKYTEGSNERKTKGIFEDGIYRTTSEESRKSHDERVEIIEELLLDEKKRVKTILTNTNSTIYYSTSDSGSSGFDTPRSVSV